MPERTGRSVQQSLDMSETKVTVDPAGLTELLRPLTTESASNPKANSKLYFQPPILQAAAVLLLANLSDATVAKYVSLSFFLI